MGLSVIPERARRARPAPRVEDARDRDARTRRAAARRSRSRAELVRVVVARAADPAVEAVEAAAERRGGPRRVAVVPLADHRRRVAAQPELLRDGRVRRADGRVRVLPDHNVLKARVDRVAAGHERRAARRAHLLHVVLLEPHAVGRERERVERRRRELGAVVANVGVAQVVRDDPRAAAPPPRAPRGRAPPSSPQRFRPGLLPQKKEVPAGDGRRETASRAGRHAPRVRRRRGDRLARADALAAASEARRPARRRRGARGRAARGALGPAGPPRAPGPRRERRRGRGERGPAARRAARGRSRPAVPRAPGRPEARPRSAPPCAGAPRASDYRDGGRARRAHGGPPPQTPPPLSPTPTPPPPPPPPRTPLALPTPLRSRLFPYTASRHGRAVRRALVDDAADARAVKGARVDVYCCPAVPTLLINGCARPPAAARAAARRSTTSRPG